MMTDPIADMFTRIRNANSIYRPRTEMPHSKLKERVAEKMKQAGFIKDYEVIDGKPAKTLAIHLKYGSDGEKVIREITRVSKPGRRIYRGQGNLKRLLNGMGVSIVSTSKGIMTDQECREQKIGGEVLGTIW